MRSYILVGVMCCLSQIPVAAQDTISTTGQSLQGTWITQLALPNGDFMPAEVGDFSADGSYTGANMDATHSVHKGVWLRVGDRQFAFTVMFFTHDASGALNGIVKARALVMLAEDEKSYDAVVERVVMDTSGKELQVITGIRGHAVRMSVELPEELAYNFMPNLLSAAIATCLLFGSLYAHDVSYDPNLTKLTLGGRDGVISVILVGDEPSPDCTVTASARAQSASDSPLVSISPVGPDPAPTITLNVHVLRQPQGSSESTSVVGSWSSTGMPGPPCSKGQTGRIAATITVTRTKPAITAVVSGASSLPGIAPSTWISINGSSLTGTTRFWNSSDFSGSNLPTKLESVSVSINENAAAFYFVSPSQLTVLSPGDRSVGLSTVAVTDAEGTTTSLTTSIQPAAPAFFSFGKSVLAWHADGCWVAENPDGAAPVYPVKPGASDAPFCAHPTAPGETIGLVGTGFGPLGSDVDGNPLTAPTDRDFSDSYWPPEPKGDQTDVPTPMFPLQDPTAIQLWIGDEILPVVTASRTRPGIDVIWVTIPPDILATTDSVTWYDVKGSMLENQLITVQIPVRTAPGRFGNSGEPR